jgi:hypothetical protein
MSIGLAWCDEFGVVVVEEPVRDPRRKERLADVMTGADQGAMWRLQQRADDLSLLAPDRLDAEDVLCVSDGVIRETTGRDRSI